MTLPTTLQRAAEKAPAFWKLDQRFAVMVAKVLAATALRETTTPLTDGEQPDWNP